MDKVKKPKDICRLGIDKKTIEFFPSVRGEFRIFEEYEGGPKTLIYENNNQILNRGGEILANCLIGINQIEFLVLGTELFGGPDADTPFEPSPKTLWPVVGSYEATIPYDYYDVSFLDRVLFAFILDYTSYNGLSPFTSAALCDDTGSAGTPGTTGEPLAVHSFPQIEKTVARRITFEWTIYFYN